MSKDNLVNFPGRQNPLFNGKIRQKLSHIVSGDDNTDGEKKVTELENVLCAYMLNFARIAGSKFGKLIIETLKDIFKKDSKDENQQNC